MTHGPTATHVVSVGRDAWVVDGFAPLPGDIVRLPGDARGTVQTVYLCAESSGLDLVRWSWIVLEDGRLLEIAPRGCALYDPPTILPHGSGPFLELAAQDGALVRFEERVRAGVWQARPVRLNLGGRRWRLTATGNLTAQRLGPAPAPGSVWAQLQTGHQGRPPEDQDVYFTLAGQGGKPTEDAALGLGVWMTDIMLAFGRRLGSTPAAAGMRIVGRADALS